MVDPLIIIGKRAAKHKTYSLFTTIILLNNSSYCAADHWNAWNIIADYAFNSNWNIFNSGNLLKAWCNTN